MRFDFSRQSGNAAPVVPLSTGVYALPVGAFTAGGGAERAAAMIEHSPLPTV